MPFFHVLVAHADKPEDLTALFLDLSEEDLERKFLAAYRAGTNIFHANAVVNINQLAKVLIIETARESDSELSDLQARSRREIEEFNRDSSVVLVSFGRGYDPADIEELGSNVTDNFIHGAPGYEPAKEPTPQPSISRWHSVINHPWFVAIAGGLIVAALAFGFGLM